MRKTFNTWCKWCRSAPVASSRPCPSHACETFVMAKQFKICRLTSKDSGKLGDLLTAIWVKSCKVSWFLSTHLSLHRLGWRRQQVHLMVPVATQVRSQHAAAALLQIPKTCCERAHGWRPSQGTLAVLNACTKWNTVHDSASLWHTCA